MIGSTASTIKLPNLGLFRSAVKNQSRIAVISNGNKYSYGELLSASNSLRMTIFPNDLQSRRVAFLMPRGFEYIRSLYAAWAAGGIAVPLCTTHPKPELEYVITDSGADTVLFHSRFTARIDPLRSSMPNVRWVESDRIYAGAEFLDVHFGEFDSHRGASLIYTSGTTGKPKGVLATHKNVEAMVSSLVSAWKWRKEDKILHVLPLHHVHGVVNALLCPLWAGATCEFTDDSHFSAKDILGRWMAAERDLSLFMAVPTIYSKLLSEIASMTKEEQKSVREACKQFRLMVSGSSALPQSVYTKWKEVAGHELLER